MHLCNKEDKTIIAETILSKFFKWTSTSGQEGVNNGLICPT